MSVPFILSSFIALFLGCYRNKVYDLYTIGYLSFIGVHNRNHTMSLHT